MTKFFQTAWHYIVGLAGIGAVSALVAVGSIPGADGLPVIVAITSALVGGGLVAAGSSTSSGATPAATSTATPAPKPVAAAPPAA